MRKSKITFLVLLALTCCVHSIDNKPVIESPTISIQLIGKIKDKNWLKIDQTLFVHSRDYNFEDFPMNVRDTSLDRKTVKYYLIPITDSETTLPNGRKIKKELTYTQILSELSMRLSDLNRNKNLYLMDLGANLWLNQKLRIKRTDGDDIQIYSNNGYKAVFEAK